jgi:hypothetical protein
MGWAYLVLIVMAGLGLALGWRLTPAPSHAAATGVARLLQLGIALTGLSVLALLLVPWLDGLRQISCTPETERAGECILGLHERGLFGAAMFVCLVGVAFAFVLRKGVLDFVQEGPVSESGREGGVGDMDTKVEARKPKDGTATKAVAGPIEAATPAPAAAAPAETPPSDEPVHEPAHDEPAPEAESVATGRTGTRPAEGPVFRAFVDERVVDLDEAIATAARRLRSDRVAVVFSRGAAEDANLALLELAEALGASRYVLEGNAAAAEGIIKGDKPDPHAADEIAGPGARHAGELALNLAGSFIQTVFLLDTRVLFPVFVLGKLTELQSVCIAHAHDEVSAACQIVLPGSNLGEAEGELVDSEGGVNARRSRVSLVKQIIEALRALEPNPAAEATAPDDDAAES